MSSNKRKKSRAWMQAKALEIQNLKTRVEQERQHALDASRARTIFPERLQTYETPDGGMVDGFVQFPPGHERVCRVPVYAPPRTPFYAAQAYYSSRAVDMRFRSVEHAATLRIGHDEHRVRWWNWELVEPNSKVEQTISHAAHHLRLALHEHVITRQAAMLGDMPIITAVRNALDEMSLLNGNQIERMNHRVLEEREFSGMNRREGYRFGGG